MAQLQINTAISRQDFKNLGFFTPLKRIDRNMQELYAGGVTLKFPRRAARYYNNDTGRQATGTAQVTGTTVLVPIYVPLAVTISRMLANITTARSGGLFQRGLYAPSSVDGMPTGPCLASTISVSTTSTGTPTTGTLGGGTLLVGTTARLPNGWYWMGLMVDATANGAVFNGISPASAKTAALIGSVTRGNVTGSAMVQGESTPQTFGTWSDLTGATFTDVITSAAPLGGYLVATVP